MKFRSFIEKENPELKRHYLFCSHRNKLHLGKFYQKTTLSKQQIFPFHTVGGTQMPGSELKVLSSQH